MAVPWLFLGKLASTLGPAALNFMGQRNANDANVNLNAENRAWMERMSSTAYQRAAKDLDAAGLNRILALGNPSSTPSNTAPRKESETKAAMDSFNTARQINLVEKKTNAEIGVMEAQEDKIRTETVGAGVRNQLLRHGEAVAGVAADFVRTARLLIEGDSPEEMARTIKRLYNQWRPKFRQALEQSGHSAQEVFDKLDELEGEAIEWVGDMFRHGDKGRKEAYDYWIDVGRRRGLTGQALVEFARSKSR